MHDRMRGSKIHSGSTVGGPAVHWRCGGGWWHKGLLRTVGVQLGSEWCARRGSPALAAGSMRIHTRRAVVACALGAAGELQLRLRGAVKDRALVGVA